jgi:N6-adenosine-specific RNA methylase IME4
MATYGDLQQGSYYVIQEVENASLELVYIPLVTEKCVLVEFQDEDQTLSWYRKSDDLFEIVEQLADEHAVIYESLFAEDDDDDELWDMDDDESDFWDLDDEEDEEDEEDKAQNN